MKDVAYFISSCFNEDECERLESTLLDRYFELLHEALERSDKAIDGRALEANWRELYPVAGSAHVVGVTGPPGGGKSTLVSALVAAARAADRPVAVLAIDPSSPVTGGAILGDRDREAFDQHRQRLHLILVTIDVFFRVLNRLLLLAGQELVLLSEAQHPPALLEVVLRLESEYRDALARVNAA